MIYLFLTVKSQNIVTLFMYYSDKMCQPFITYIRKT